MNTQKRDKCVICNNDTFELINNFKNFHVMAISNNNIADDYYDLNIILCNTCKCLQIE
jgi:hypothetical protein